MKKYLFLFIFFLAPALHAFNLGLNCDNYHNQLDNEKFRKAILKFKPDFIVWHIAPKDEIFNEERLGKIVNFCRKNKIKYLFNTEAVNYLPDLPLFMHKDGTKRWDLLEDTLKWLKDDKLFLGIVYDEAMHFQALNHTIFDGKEVKPYFADTKNLSVKKAYEKVLEKIKRLHDYYKKYNKIMVFEMVFPNYAHVIARGGGILAPKLLKENFNDLMYYFYSSAAIEYNSPMLWANIDLWFHGNFPFYGKREKKNEYYHTPEELYNALVYAYKQGFDYAYIEHVKALIDKNYNLTEYGKMVIQFQKIKKTLKRKSSWRDIKPEYIVKFFPYGYWGQRYTHGLIPDHPYGSFKKDKKLKKSNLRLLKFYHKISKGKIPEDADNWNAIFHPYFQKTKYFPLASLPPILIFDFNYKGKVDKNFLNE